MKNNKNDIIIKSINGKLDIIGVLPGIVSAKISCNALSSEKFTGKKTERINR